MEAFCLLLVRASRHHRRGRVRRARKSVRRRGAYSVAAARTGHKCALPMDAAV